MSANRLSWDEYFAKIVKVTSERSSCQRLHDAYSLRIIE